MNPIRAFVISSSIFLCIWLAASYTTQFHQTAPSPATQQPASTALKVNADTELEEEPGSFARNR